MTMSNDAPLSYDAVHAFVRDYGCAPGGQPPFDVNGVVHLMLAALDNLRAHWIDGDLDQIALSVTQEQRLLLIKIGDHLRDHDETGDAGD
jgi:hypothetical protein